MAIVAAGIGATTTTNFRIVSGIAKPQDAATLGIFQGLQRAINATLGRFRAGGVSNVIADVSTDGDLGPKTLTAAQFVASVLVVRAPELTTFSSNVNNLAINAVVFASRLGELGGFKASTAADPARAATPQAASGSTAIVPSSALPEPLSPPHAPDGKKGIHWAWWVGGALVLAVGGYAIFRVTRKPKTLSGDDSDDDFGYEPADDIIDL